ncbi:MAG: alpha-glucan family phosphorylase [Candidatus Saganbacteria bacterium]|nr:alpha-glucan family phosphorylase [Candidatus Saganbacteria bacterium]
MDNNILELIGIDKNDERHVKDITASEFFGYPLQTVIDAENRLVSKETPSVAYFSMEFGLGPSIYHTFKTKNKIAESNMSRKHEIFSNMMQMDYYHTLQVDKILDLPLYSGGLGVLAGDALKSAADLGISLTGIGILWHKGYFKQKFWFKGGGQFPEETTWDPYSYPGLIPLEKTVEIELSGAKLKLKLWKYYIYSYDLKNVVPLILLDANCVENPEYLRELTDQLYRSNNNWIKIAQRMILGIGGMKALETLGYSVKKYHLNEGHAALAFLEKAQKGGLDAVKDNFAYTCHTPVEAGHDRFNFQEIEAALGEEKAAILREHGRDLKNPSQANLTILAMNAKNVNGVSQKHGEVTRLQFPQYAGKIRSITNGVHTFTWMSDSIRDMLKKYKDRIGDFEADPVLLKNVASLKNDVVFRKELLAAHRQNKETLSKYLKSWFFDPNTFTIAWARRFAGYKRPTLLFHDVSRLISIARDTGPVQVLIAGKAHPADTPASLHMDELMEKINRLGGQRKILRVCFLENYDTYFAKMLTSSVDVWLNNPLPPFEASGTSGMKAIVNGVIQLSTLDGWIVEAADKNIGKIFGYVPKEGEIGSESDLKMKEDSAALYDSLDGMVKLYYDTLTEKIRLEDSGWVDMMINCIEQSAYFSTQRMIREYNEMIWDGRSL